MIRQRMKIVKGTTSQLARIVVRDTTSTNGEGALTGLVWNSAGLAANYTREGDAAETSITLATMTEGTWATGGFVEMDATDLAGLYEIGIPDAALATGADFVELYYHGATNMDPTLLLIELVDPVRSPVVVNWGLLEQSTNVHKLIGPVINIETGAPVTSVTLGNITAARVTQTASTVTRTALTLAGSGDNQFTHVGDGYWQIDLTTTDTGTLGNITITLRDDDVFHPVQANALVVPSNIYDSLVNDSDVLNVSVTQWLGTAVTAATAGRPDVNLLAINDDTDDAADLGTAIDNTNNYVMTNVKMISDDSSAANNLEGAFDGTGYAPAIPAITVDVKRWDGGTKMITALSAMGTTSTANGTGTLFTVDDAGFAPTNTQFEVDAGDATDDHYNGGRVVWASGALLGARYDITDYDGANTRFTVSSMVAAPADGDTFIIV